MSNTSLRALAVEIARETAERPEVNVKGQWIRNDIYVVSSESPVSPFELWVKHYASSKISTHETGRINVKVASSAISVGTLIEKASERGLGVVDVWQTESDLEEEMGQNNEPVVEFGLERAE